MDRPSDEFTLSTTWIRLIFFWISSGFALVTMLTLFCLVLGASFKFFSYGTLIIALTATFLTVARWRKQTTRVDTHDWHILSFIFSIAFLCLLLALISHKPNRDDYNYGPNAVYHLNNPDSAMGFEIKYIDTDGIPCNVFQQNSTPFEYSIAAFAFLTGSEYIYVNYIFISGLIGFLIPLALFYLLSHFSSDKMGVVLGTLAAICLLLILRDTVHTFGNYAFPRVFQGKTFLLAAGIPLFAAASLDYFKFRDWNSWIFLLLVSTALMGTTNSAAIIIPPLSVLLFIAFFTIAENRQKLWKIFIPYFSSMVFLCGYSAFMVLKAPLSPSAIIQLNNSRPQTLLGQINRHYLNTAFPLTPIIVIGLFIIALVVLKKKVKTFIFTWLISALILFFNPLSARILMKYVTTSAVFWRLFYIIPFPLVGGILAIAMYQYLQKKRISLRKILLAFTCFFLICVLIYIVTFPDGETAWIGWPTMKLPRYFLNTAKQVIQIAPKGLMLAQGEISGIILLMSTDFPQIVERKGASVFRICPDDPQAEQKSIVRRKAARFVGGGEKQFMFFKILLQKKNITNIVIKQSTALKTEVSELLNQYGFSSRSVVNSDYFLFSKQTAEPLNE